MNAPSRIVMADIELRRVECGQGHPATWLEHDDEDWYEPPCPWCLAADAYEAHTGCRHALHGRWRTWRVTGKLASQAYVLGIIPGFCTTYGAGCSGCVTFGARWRARRSYILGVTRDTWRCLLVGHHIPGDPIGFGMCSKCLPCPECGSKTAGHKAGCREDLGWSS